LPIDLKKFCFNFLQPIDLVNAASVSKEFEQLASDEELWKQHYKHVWEAAGLEKFPNEPSFKKMFLKRLKRTAYRVIRFKCRVIHSLIIGDEQTGKTTLIEGIREAFTKSVVQSQTKPEKLRIQSLDPERITFKKSIFAGINTKSNFYMKLFDSHYQRGEEEEKYLDTIREQLLECDAIILTYDATKIETLERLRDFWLPFIRRFCPREIPLLAVGTKSDLRGRQNPPQEVTDILNIIRQQFNLEGSTECSPKFETGCLNVFDLIDAIVVCPMITIFDQNIRHYMPFVEEFVRRIFEFYDKDGDGFLNAEEFVACFNELCNTEHDVGHFTVMQNEITAARPDLIGADGRISFAAFIYWFEIPIGSYNLNFVWNSLRTFGFHSIYYTSLYPPNLQMSGMTMEKKLAQPVVKGPRAVTLLSDMRRFLTERNEDEDVKYWVSCSYAGVTTSPDSRDLIMNTENALDVFVTLLHAKNPHTARMASMSIGDFIDDNLYRPQIVACKEISERLMELLGLDLDPALLVSVSRPLVGLSNEEAIQDLIVEKGFVKLIPKLLHIEFAELQYNTGQIVYNLVGHERRTEIFTEEMFDSLLFLMKSPLQGIVETGLHCGGLAVTYTDLFDILNTERNMPLIDEIIKLATSEPYKFHHPATLSLSVFTKFETLREKIVELKSYNAFFRMLKDSPVTKCPGTSLQQTYIAFVNLVKSEKFLEVVEIQALFTAILMPMSAPQTYLGLIPDLAICLTEITMSKPTFAEALIKVLEKELTSRKTQAISLQYLKVIEALAYDLVMHNKDMANLIDAGFIKFIKNQLKAFKSTKAVIPLLDALGILATKHNVKDDELNAIFNELLNNKRLIKEIDFKFVLEWCMGNVEGAGKQVPKGVYLSDEYKTKAIKISHDRLSARLDIATFETVAANVSVTKGKWYYEVKLYTDGIMQIGWASLQTLKTGINPDEGTGVGDDDFSYAGDLNRNKAWHGGGKVYGNVKWKAGDILGCYLDLDKGQILFALNGVQQGVAFENVVAGDGLFPAMTMSNNQQVRFNFGTEPFAHALTGGFKPYIRVLGSAGLSTTGLAVGGAVLFGVTAAVVGAYFLHKKSSK
jgi:GTPase SAR1 family protein